jgi:hypothetical protein
MTSKEYARKFMLEWYWETPSLTEEELGKLLASEHCGDCTRVAAPCLRCQAEQIEADTEDLAKVIDEATVDLRAKLAESEKLHSWQADSLKAFRDKFGAESNCQALDAIDAMHVKLAQAERAREEALAACEATDKEWEV